jgi:hypothetical protein
LNPAANRAESRTNPPKPPTELFRRQQVAGNPPGLAKKRLQFLKDDVFQIHNGNLLQHFRQKYFGLLVATYILADGVSLVMGKIQVALGQTPPAAVQPAASQ